MPTHTTVMVAGPPSNSPTSAFNRFRVTFLEPVFSEIFTPLGARRRLIGSLSAGHLHNGHFVEHLDFTTRDGGWRWGDTPWEATGTGSFLPFEQWTGVGQPSFTLTIGDFKAPIVGDTAQITVRSTDWMVPGTPVYIEGGTYQVVGATGPHRVNIRRIA